MSRQIPPKYNSKQLQLQFVNCLVSTHDIKCSCNGPLEHIVLDIFKQERNLRFNSQEKQFIQTCLTTTEDVPGGNIIDELGEDELERLFENDGDQDDGKDTSR